MEALRRTDEDEPGAHRGVYAAVLTPVRSDGSADLERLLEHCRWLFHEGVHGVSLLGTTGEGNSFLGSERREVLSAMIAAGIPASRILPAAGGCVTEDTVDLVSHMVRLGCAGVLMLPPFYYKHVSEEGIIRAFAEAIEKIGDSRLRLYLYNIPQVTGILITEKIVAELVRRYPTVIRGLKDSSGDLDYCRRLLASFPHLSIFTGNDAQLAELLRAGGAGSISGVTNINARNLRRLYDGWNTPQGAELSSAAARVAHAVEAFAGVPALKHLLAHYRRDPEWLRMRPPLEPLTAAQGESLIARIESVGLVPPVFQRSR
jgi:4-hydroxy-tetrahydrodipicolinate synthase